MKTSIVFSVILFFTFSTMSFAKEVKKDFHKSFDVEKGFTLKLESGDGDVTITPWNKNFLDIEVHYRVDYTSYRLAGDDQFDVDFQEHDKTIHVTGKEKSHTFVGVHIRKQYEYIYTIKAPDYLILDINGEDGSISIENWKGNIECTTDDGDINLTDIDNSQTDLRTEDGDLFLKSLKSDLLIKTDDGDAELTMCEVSRGKITAEDGEIRRID